MGRVLCGSDYVLSGSDYVAFGEIVPLSFSTDIVANSSMNLYGTTNVSATIEIDVPYEVGMDGSSEPPPPVYASMNGSSEATSAFDPFIAPPAPLGISANSASYSWFDIKVSTPVMVDLDVEYVMEPHYDTTIYLPKEMSISQSYYFTEDFDPTVVEPVPVEIEIEGPAATIPELNLTGPEYYEELLGSIDATCCYSGSFDGYSTFDYVYLSSEVTLEWSAVMSCASYVPTDLEMTQSVDYSSNLDLFEGPGEAPLTIGVSTVYNMAATVYTNVFVGLDISYDGSAFIVMIVPDVSKIKYPGVRLYNILYN